MAGRARIWLRKAVIACAVANPVALLGVWLLLRFVGERWWVTGIALYLPPIGFGLPLILLVPLLLWLRLWKLLALQLTSLWLLLFPLMGLNLSWPSVCGPECKKLRIVSCNANSGHWGLTQLSQELVGHDADVIFLQELPEWKVQELEATLGPKYPHRASNGEFFVASRFPIVSEEFPERIPYFGRLRSPRFMKVTLDTPLGKVAAFHVHTVSPRGGFRDVRGQGLRKEILSGRLFSGEHAGSVQEHSALRELQIRAMSEWSSREPGPVLIVGDTNSPAASYVRGRYLGHFQDGFREAGSGFGWTFPARRPWLRIDVVLATDHLRFTSFEVADAGASDHRCVVAGLAAPSP